MKTNIAIVLGLLLGLSARWVHATSRPLCELRSLYPQFSEAALRQTGSQMDAFVASADSLAAQLVRDVFSLTLPIPLNFRAREPESQADYLNLAQAGFDHVLMQMLTGVAQPLVTEQHPIVNEMKVWSRASAARVQAQLDLSKSYYATQRSRFDAEMHAADEADRLEQEKNQNAYAQLFGATEKFTPTQREVVEPFREFFLAAFQVLAPWYVKNLSSLEIRRNFTKLKNGSPRHFRHVLVKVVDEFAATWASQSMRIQALHQILFESLQYAIYLGQNFSELYKQHYGPSAIQAVLEDQVRLDQIDRSLGPLAADGRNEEQLEAARETRMGQVLYQRVSELAEYAPLKTQSMRTQLYYRIWKRLQLLRQTPPKA